MEKEFTKSYAIKRIAELTEQIEEWVSLYSALMKDCQMQIEEYNKLKNQLAEKDEEIKHIHLEIKSGAYIQDKISFAVEQLEKVKEIIANHTQELWTCENDDIDFVLYEEIDKQIEELKKGENNE